MRTVVMYNIVLLLERELLIYFQTILACFYKIPILWYNRCKLECFSDSICGDIEKRNKRTISSNRKNGNAVRSILRIILVTISMFFVFNSSASGACCCWRFMHNDHDTLLIGEIIQIISGDNDVELIIRATSFIVSANSLHRNSVSRQIWPELARVGNIRLDHSLAVGDYVIASLNWHESENHFRVAWGLYPVDSLNFQTLTISPNNPSNTSEMHTDFVNSGGHGGQVIFAGEEITNGHDLVSVISIVSLTFAVTALILTLFTARAIRKREKQEH